MHFVVAVLCASALWTMLAIFTLRLWQAIASGKSWSRRRFAGCMYAYTLSIIQVRSFISWPSCERSNSGQYPTFMLTLTTVDLHSSAASRDRVAW